MMHDGDNGFLLMYFDDDALLDESPSLGYLGKGKDKKKVKICVYENEGPIPHCHIIGLPQGEVCVRLDKPEYFSHGTKVAKFNSKEKKLFDDFMHDKDEFGSVNWSITASLWNRYADDDEIKQHIKIKSCPNYLNLE